MSNDCCGTLKVVTKNKDVFKRIKDILNYEDKEFCLYRCKQCDEVSDVYEEDGYFVQEFNVDGAWECGQFFMYGDQPESI